jgi:cytochrome c oxidase subunit 2
VRLLLRSIDVLHNFTVPQFRAKMDLVPGMITHVWLTPTRTGSFDLLCEELCGIGHFAMRGRVSVDAPSDFDAWLARQPTFAQTRAHGAGDAPAGARHYALCATCHGAAAEGNAALHAPKLAGLGAWYVERQLQHFRRGLRGARDDDANGRTMAGMALTLADDAAVRDVSAYIASLPDVVSARTVEGDASAARALFVSTCGVCHGQDGRGRQSTNAPTLAGMSDWYLVTQLQNFRSGIRGAHPEDMYGRQMALMAAALTDDRAIGNMVAHVSALR